MTGGLTESERRLVEWLGPGAIDDPPESLPAEFVDRNKLAAVIADRAPDEYGHLGDGRLRRRSLEAVRELGSALEQQGVAYAVIKSVPIVPKPVGDIDVLVGDIEIASRLLTERNYTVASREPYKAVYKKYDDVRIAIHLHDEISWEGVPYLDSVSVLDTTRQRGTERGDLSVPSPEDELLITAAHMLFEQGNGRILFHNVLEYETHLDRGEIDIESMLATADSNHWRRPLTQFLRGLDLIYRDMYGVSLDPRFDRFDTGRTATYDPLFKSWLFSISTLTAARLYRIRRADRADARGLLHTYFIDTLDSLAERYGITYTKKRLSRWVN